VPSSNPTQFSPRSPTSTSNFLSLVSPPENHSVNPRSVTQHSDFKRTNPEVCEHGLHLRVGAMYFKARSRIAELFRVACCIRHFRVRDSAVPRSDVPVLMHCILCTCTGIEVRSGARSFPNAVMYFALCFAKSLKGEVVLHWEAHNYHVSFLPLGRAQPRYLLMTSKGIRPALFSCLLAHANASCASGQHRPWIVSIPL
jgi:hypothetical protein